MIKSLRSLTALAVLASAPVLVIAQSTAPAPASQAAPANPNPPATPLTMDQLEQLVSPIALYPDSLVAQILAAATYPTQIVEAERYLQDNPNLTGKDLANAVDQQDWAPSVKALTAFPSVLSDMDKNLSWTSELGDTNYNQSQDVMSAIQAMRAKAHDAGNLQSNSQETVTQDNGDYEIAPADPQVVYVPVYDPAVVYGYPVAMWPGFYPWWTIGDPYISFGIGFGMGPFWGFGWGWNNWGCGWGDDGGVFFGGERWYSRSNDFYDHNAFVHGNYRGYGGGGFQHGGRGVYGGNGVRTGLAGNHGINNNHIVNRGFNHGVAGNRGLNNGVNRGFNNGVNRGNGFAGGGNRTLRGFGNQGNTHAHTGFFGGLFGHGGGTVSNYGARGFSSSRSSGGFGGGSYHGGGFGGGSYHGGGFGGGGFHSGGFGGGGGFHGGGGRR